MPQSAVRPKSRNQKRKQKKYIAKPVVENIEQNLLRQSVSQNNNQAAASQEQQFPHEKPRNSRIYSRTVMGAIIVFTAVFFVVIVPKNVKNYNKSWQIRIHLFQDTVNPENHLAMGEYFETQHNFSAAKREYQIAQKYSAINTNQLVQRVQQKAQGRALAQQSLATWSQFVMLHPNYADGWAYMASLYWQLGDTAKFTDATNKALAADPNSTAALQMQWLTTHAP